MINGGNMSFGKSRRSRRRKKTQDREIEVSNIDNEVGNLDSDCDDESNNLLYVIVVGSVVLGGLYLLFSDDKNGQININVNNAGESIKEDNSDNIEVNETINEEESEQNSNNNNQNNNILGE
jgi:hypothetical protein